MNNSKLKINHSYRCVKDVIMNNGLLAYLKDKIYKCEARNALTDEQGDIYHYWSEEEEFNEYFIDITGYSFDNHSGDNVNHPSHYTWLKDKCGIEVIDIVRHMDFCLGNSIKYILRAGHKQDASLTNKQKEIEDLKKAVWYIEDRIKQLGGDVEDA